MELLCWQTLYFVIILCGPLHAVDLSEPNCYSRYDYEEKLLLKLLKIEDEVGKFRQFIDALKIKEDSMEQQRKQEHGQFMTAMKQTEAFLDTLYTNVNNSLKVLDSELSQFKQNMTSMVSPIAFTVKCPKDTVEGYITFNTVVTNEGEGFDQTSGKFTCRVPGLYYFGVHILKAYSGSISTAYCRICMDGDLKVMAYSGPGTSTSSNAHYGISSSVYLRLNKDDVVGLCTCTSVSSMHAYSSFSGHLVSKV